MSGGWAPWQDSFDDELPTRTSSTAPPNPPPHVPRVQPTAHASLLPEMLTFDECRGGVIPDDPLKEIRRVNGVLARLREAQEPLPPKVRHGIVAQNSQIMRWAKAGAPVVFVAALTAACSPRHDKNTRPRELFRRLVCALKDPAWYQSYKDLVARVKRALSCLARVQYERQHTQRTSSSTLWTSR